MAQKLNKENLILGEFDVMNLYLGNTEVSAVYLGNDKIWPAKIEVEVPNGSSSVSLIVGWLNTTTARLIITVNGGSTGILIPGTTVDVDVRLKSSPIYAVFPVWSCRVSAFDVPAGETITQTYRGSFTGRRTDVLYTYETAYNGKEYSGDMLDMVGELRPVS